MNSESIVYRAIPVREEEIENDPERASANIYGQPPSSDSSSAPVTTTRRRRPSILKGCFILSAIALSIVLLVSAVHNGRKFNYSMFDCGHKGEYFHSRVGQQNDRRDSHEWTHPGFHGHGFHGHGHGFHGRHELEEESHHGKKGHGHGHGHSFWGHHHENPHGHYHSRSRVEEQQQQEEEEEHGHAIVEYGTIQYQAAGSSGLDLDATQPDVVSISRTVIFIPMSDTNNNNLESEKEPTNVLSAPIDTELNEFLSGPP